LKNQVNPIAAVVAVVVIVLIAGFIYWRGTIQSHDEIAKPPGMPADAAAEFQKRMGSASATGPSKSNAAPGGTMGGGGYIMPPGAGGR